MSERIEWDATVKGFGKRIRDSGAASWIVVYRPEGSRQSRRFTLGPCAKLTKPVARKRAKAILGKVANGEDPQGDKVAARAGDVAARKATFGWLAELWFEAGPQAEQHATAHKARSLLDHDLLPRFGRRPLSKLGRDEIRAWHRAKSRTAPTQANMALRILRRVLRWGRAEGLTNVPDPSESVKLNPERTRERVLTKSELVALAAALDDLEPRFPVLVEVVRVLMLTGARLSEIVTLRWDEIYDAGNGLREIRKERKARRHKAPAPIVLDRAAQDILARQPEGSPWCFPSRTQPDRPYAAHSVDRLMRVLRQEYDLTGWRLHDLRRTKGSLMLTQGAPMAVVSKALGHAHVGITQRVYAHMADEPVREAEQHTQGTLGAIVEGRPEAPVRKLRG